MHEPSVSDYNFLKRILRYVKGTADWGIDFNRDTDFTVRAYIDSDWAGCQTTRRSTGGFCTFLGSNIISWSSKKQLTVSRSSTEAEYRSLSETASELSWLCSIMREIGIPVNVTPELYCDNLSSLHLTTNPTYHKRSKHFELDYHYVRERVALRALVVRHIPATQQLADIFTKSLPFKPFDDLRFKLGVGSSPTQSLRGTIESMKQNGSVYTREQKGKQKMGHEYEKPTEELKTRSPGFKSTAQRSEEDKVQKRKVQIQSMTKACTGESNGVKLSNIFSALDVKDA